jgi:effector-binding domain-containing protein
MRRLLLERIAFLSMLPALFVGCSGSTKESTVNRDSERAQTRNNTTVKKPFMFREAKLPKDFPPPGAVGEIVIKDYPAYRLARVRSGKNGVSGGPDAMFNPLFNHIKRNENAMTAPVEIGYQSHPESAEKRNACSVVSMAFLYGESSWGRLGVDAADPRVVVEDIPAMTMISIGVRGDYTDARCAEALSKLGAWVEAHRGEVRVVGPPRYLAYNSPFVLGFLRYGEVQLPVEKVKTASRPS